MSLPAQALAALIALIVACGAGFKLGLNVKQGEWDAHTVASREAQDKALQAAATEIAKMEVKNVTIRQAVQREVVTREVFRDCRSGPVAVGLLNTAAGHPEAPASGASDVPGSAKAD